MIEATGREDVIRVGGKGPTGRDHLSSARWEMGGAESYEKEAVKGMWRDRRQKHDGKFCRRTPSSQGRGGHPAKPALLKPAIFRNVQLYSQTILNINMKFTKAFIT